MKKILTLEEITAVVDAFKSGTLNVSKMARKLGEGKIDKVSRQMIQYHIRKYKAGKPLQAPASTPPPPRKGPPVRPKPLRIPLPEPEKPELTDAEQDALWDKQEKEAAAKRAADYAARRVIDQAAYEDQSEEDLTNPES